MRSLLITLSLAAILPMSAMAAELDQRMTNRLERMDILLELSDAQYSQVEKIMETEHEQRMKFTQSHQSERTAFFKEAHQLKTNIHEQLVNILTSEQMNQLREDRHYRPREDGNKPLEKKLNELDLSKTQRKQVNQLLDDTKSERKHMQAVFKQIKVRREKHRNQLNQQMSEILTPDQMKKFKVMKPYRFDHK